MTEYSYKTVPALVIELLPDNFIELKVPWLIVKAQIDSHSYEELLKFSTNNILTGEGLEQDSLGYILSYFHKYPFFYIQPRISGFPAAHVIEENLNNSLKKDYEDAFTTNGQFTISHEDSDWVLEQAKIPGSASLWDPVAVISCLRIIHNKVDCFTDNARNLGLTLEDYLKNNPAQFAIAIGTIIKNNYIVTHRCEESLKPALKLHPALTNCVKKFIQEERGHDRILLASLNSLPGSALDIPYPPETDIMMSLLKKAAHINTVAFLSIIQCFEGESYKSHQKIYNLMNQSKSTQDAVKDLQKHERINQLGEHSLVGIEMAKSLPPLCRSTVMNGLYLFGNFLYYFHSSQKTLHELVNSSSCA